MAYVILNLVCVAALVGIDQAIKLWATQYLAPVEAITVIPHVVELRFVLNQGMAFSLLSGKQLFLILATSAALLLVAYLLFFRSRGRYLQQAALLLLGLQIIHQMQVAVFVRRDQQARIVEQVAVMAGPTEQRVARADEDLVVREKQRHKQQPGLAGQAVDLVTDKQIDIAVEQHIQQSQVVAEIDVQRCGRMLLPILLLVATDLIRKAFRPVSLLADEVHQRDERNLTPFPEDAIPDEIRPFVGGINKLLHKVNDAMQTQSRFIADAAHELRTPLTALSLQAERLSASEIEPPRPRPGIATPSVTSSSFTAA